MALFCFSLIAHEISLFDLDDVADTDLLLVVDQVPVGVFRVYSDSVQVLD